MKKQCKTCSSSIQKPYGIGSREWENKKFCSRECYWKSKVGEKHSWGDKISQKLKGVKKSPEHRQKVIEANLGKEHLSLRGEKHFAWKGDKVNYGSLHDWVARYRGREKKCSVCGLSDTKRRYYWANISGNYERKLDDWIRVCMPCHSEMDKGRNSIKKVWKKVKNEYVRIVLTNNN